MSVYISQEKEAQQINYEKNLKAAEDPKDGKYS